MKTGKQIKRALKSLFIVSVFGLQAAPAITGTFTNAPGATSPYSNALSGGQHFFRLVK